MIVFMHKYIERIVDVTCDGNPNYHVVSALLGKREENIHLSATQLLKELKAYFDAIHVSLIYLC